MYNERKVPVGVLHMTLVYNRGEWFAHTVAFTITNLLILYVKWHFLE